MDYSIIPGNYKHLVRRASNNNREERYDNIDDFIINLKEATEADSSTYDSHSISQARINKIMEENISFKKNVDEILKYLYTNIENENILKELFPKLEDSILNGLIDKHKSIFEEMLLQYDAYITSNTNWEYCDVIAKFYKNVFFRTDSYEIKTLILERLPKMGYSNNRYFVGKVYGEIVSKITDQGLIIEVKKILESNNSMAKWNKEFLEKYNLPTLLNNLILSL